MRVVSLLAAGTEIVCALGLRDRLVGRSHECDYPPDVRALPAVSTPSFPVSGSSRATDHAVKDRLRRALSIYEVDADRLGELAPDVLVTQTQCEVCAVSPSDVERATSDWLDRDVRIVSLAAQRLDGIWDDTRRVAAALHASERGEQLVDSLRARLSQIAGWAHGRGGPRPTVVTVEWMDPLMTAGNWMPELVAVAGGTQLLGVAGRHSPYITWDQVVAADPDVLLVSPCGFTVERTQQEMHLLTNKPGWADLRAVKADRVFVADGNAYFHRPGPRIVESAQILAEILAPAAGAIGTGYVRFADHGR